MIQNSLQQLLPGPVRILRHGIVTHIPVSYTHLEAATNFTIKNIEFTSKEITGGYDDYDHDDFVIELSDTPIIWDKRNNEMYLVYKTLPDTSGLSAEDEEGIYFYITDGVNVETDPDGAFGEIFIFVCANPELSF